MSRLVPHPFLAMGLVVMWLLLNGFSLGHLVLGSGVALLAGWSLGALEPLRVRLRNPGAMLRLAGLVAGDILRSNLAVARQIVTGGRGGQRRAVFAEIPLRLRDPLPLTVLAIIVTATPGTAWLEHDPDSGILLLHVFDAEEEAMVRDLIRNRYEALLMEIFA